MSAVEDMLSELESIGAIGEKVTMMRLVPKVVEASPPPPEPEAEEVNLDEPEVVSEAELREAQLRETIATLSLKADEKLAAVIEAVQDLRGVFQELHEATRGEPHEEISEAT